MYWQESPLDADSRESRWNQFWSMIRSTIMPTFLIAAFWLLRFEFRHIDFKDIAISFRSMPTMTVILALMITLLNYCVMSGYDLIAIGIIRSDVTKTQIVGASKLSYAVTNLMGTILGGTPVRFRLYSACGLSVAEIIRVIYFIAVAFWMGLITLGGVFFVATPFDIPPRFHLPLATSQPLGIILLVISAMYFLTCAVRRTPLHILGVNFQPPPFKIAVLQLAVALSDFLLCASTLYVLLPPDTQIGFLHFAAIFLLAIFIALISHVPGGIGVLELVLVTMLPKSSHSVIASLLAFRVIYYLLPFLIAMLTVAELSHFLGSVAGALLIVLAHGLYRRIDAAWTLTVGLLVVGIVTLLTKGFDYEEAFVMFGCQGKSWIAMGDPVGPETSADDAAWKFREACDIAGTWPVFYKVDEHSLSRYIDMGLSMVKLGEEARVPLKEFSLAHSSCKDLRRTNKKAIEDGLRFEIVPQIKVAAMLPQLKLISDAWLSEKSAAEKGFSLGFFNEKYLLQCDIALIFNKETPIASPIVTVRCDAKKSFATVRVPRLHSHIPTDRHSITIDCKNVSSPAVSTRLVSD